MHNNGDVGLFLCWRVRQGKFTDNVIEDNGRYGISIGHKDTDNEFANNTIARNGVTGVLFREETMNNSGHRNIFRANKIVDNGSAKEGYGFLIQPRAGDLVIETTRSPTPALKNRAHRSTASTNCPEPARSGWQETPCPATPEATTRKPPPRSASCSKTRAQPA